MDEEEEEDVVFLQQQQRGRGTGQRVDIEGVDGGGGRGG